jgi:hypothetical protein
MQDELLSTMAHERIDAMLREADHYRRMIDAAPLTFRRREPVRALRVVVAGGLQRLADAIAPQECCA